MKQKKQPWRWLGRRTRARNQVEEKERCSLMSWLEMLEYLRFERISFFPLPNEQYRIQSEETFLKASSHEPIKMVDMYWTVTGQNIKRWRSAQARIEPYFCLRVSGPCRPYWQPCLLLQVLPTSQTLSYFCGQPLVIKSEKDFCVAILGTTKSQCSGFCSQSSVLCECSVQWRGSYFLHRK